MVGFVLNAYVIRMEISPPLLELIGSIRSQTDVITSMASAGFALNLFFIANVFGVYNEVKVKNVNYKFLLFLSLIMFLLSMVAGYFLYSFLTGFFAEIFAGVSASSGEFIVSASSHFAADYWWLQDLGAVQLLIGIAAAAVLASWFVLNTLGGEWVGK